MKLIKICVAALLLASVIFSTLACDITVRGGRKKDSDDSDRDNKSSFSTKEAQNAYEDFMGALSAGDFDTVNEMVPLGSMLYTAEESASNGFLNAVFACATYTVESKNSIGDGEVLIKLKIENVDLKALLLSLPEGISSKEAAKVKMNELLPTAERKIFDAEVIVRENGDGAQIVVTESFANALTGGLNDILSEIVAEEMLNEASN